MFQMDVYNRRALPWALNSRRNSFQLEMRLRYFFSESYVKFMQFETGLLNQKSFYHHAINLVV